MRFVPSPPIPPVDRLDANSQPHLRAPLPIVFVELGDGMVVSPQFYVFTSEAELLRESVARLPSISEIESDWPELGRQLSAPAPGEGGRAAVIGTQRVNNYFHWWIDCLPRIWLIEERLGALPSTLLLPPLEHSFQRESLRLLGVDHRVREEPPGVSSYPELLFASGLSFGGAQMISPLLADFAGSLRKRLRLNLVRGTRRLLVSRAAARKRRVTNEEELATELGRYGVEVVELERLPVAEQARLFAEAELVIATHGAGLTNILFCAPGTRVIEVFPVHMVHASSYVAMAASLRCPYGYLTAMPEGSPGDDDITVDVKRAVEMVAAACDAS